MCQASRAALCQVLVCLADLGEAHFTGGWQSPEALPGGGFEAPSTLCSRKQLRHPNGYMDKGRAVSLLVWEVNTRHCCLPGT